MKKLYMVNVTMEGDMDVPVYAESKDEAETMARDAVTMHDFDFETYAYANEVNAVQEYYKNEIPEGTNQTCEQILNELNKEKLQHEMEESWPKLPGFESATQ